MIERSVRVLYVSIGFVCLFVGVIGVFVPLLPTTPFVLLAAYLFSKGNQRLYGWLLSRPTIGPVILDWQQSGVIRTRAKIAATIAIILAFGGTLAFVPRPPLVTIVMLVIATGLLAFILTRPSAPPAARSRTTTV